jgi:ParB family chromosome partitioning protein
MSVRAVEEAVKERNSLGGAPTGRTTRSSKLRPPGILELEELLSSHLDTRVKVDLGSKRGRVTIDFASLEDLERIYRAMTEPPTRS